MTFDERVPVCSGEHLEGTGRCEVSVIVPMFNVESFVSRCLTSLAAQTLTHFEVLCVDDGSTDGTGRIVEEFALRDVRFKVLHQTNAGAGPARNRGLEAANGEYVYFVDPDDWLDPEALEVFFERAKALSADIVVAPRRYVSAETGAVEAVYGFGSAIVKLKQPFSRNDCPADILNFAISVPWNKFFRRRFVLENGLRFQSLPRSNDVFFVNLAMATARRIGLVERPLYNYVNDRPGSLHLRRDRYPMAFLEAYSALWRELGHRGLAVECARSFLKLFYESGHWNLARMREVSSVRACYVEFRSLLQQVVEVGDIRGNDFMSERFRRGYEAVLTDSTPVSFYRAEENFGEPVPLASVFLRPAGLFRRMARAFLPEILRRRLRAVFSRETGRARIMV